MYTLSYSFIVVFSLFFGFGHTEIISDKNEASQPLMEVNQNIDSRNPNLHVFIHVCTLNHWQKVFEAQLKRIEKSGLYDACTSISAGVLGEGDLTPFLERYPKLNIVFQDSNLKLYERPTLNELYKLSLLSNENTYVLYLHTKGVTRFVNNRRMNKPNDYRGIPSPYVNDWRLYMEYFLIDRWQDCITCLKDESYQVCGVNWLTQPKPHFSGNFWWANANYISTLPGNIGPGYCDTEFWIGLNNPLVRCFHQSGVSHYSQPYPESRYKTSDLLRTAKQADR